MRSRCLPIRKLPGPVAFIFSCPTDMVITDQIQIYVYRTITTPYCFLYKSSDFFLLNADFKFIKKLLKIFNLPIWLYEIV